MEWKVFSFALLLVICGGSYIATTSIGIQCSNSCEKYKKEHETATSFLISHLVAGIFITIIGIVGMYLGIADRGRAVYEELKSGDF